MLFACDTLRIGIMGDPYPYIVPVSFGMEVAEDGKPVLYVHSSKEGEKVNRLRAHPEVCIEADQFLGVEKTAAGITARYESIIGYGKCAFVSDPEERKKGSVLSWRTTVFRIIRWTAAKAFPACLFSALS